MHRTPWLALTLFLAACGGSATDPNLGIDVGGRRLPVVDMHLHTGDWNALPPQQQAFFTQILPTPPGLTTADVFESIVSTQGIMGQLDQAKINLGVVFAVYAADTIGVASNELVRDRVAQAPDRLLGMASLDLRDWDNQGPAQLAALERALLDDDMIGIKLAPPHTGMELDDRRYYGIYQVAARVNAPVFVHTGNSPTPGVSSAPLTTDPAFLEDAVRQHPDVRFIFGHSGYDFINRTTGFLDTCLRLAQQYPNVWLEPSAIAGPQSDPTGQNLVEVYRRYKAAGLVDRVIYGSDGPQGPGVVAATLRANVDAMQAAGYTTDEIAGVLAVNFARCFRPSLVRVARGRGLLP